MRDVARYAPFLQRVGGDLLVGGGDPLLQAYLPTAVLRRAKSLGIPTILDRSGAAFNRRPSCSSRRTS